MSDEKDAAREKFSWRLVWIQVAVCVVVWVLMNVIYSAGCAVWRDLMEFRDFRRGDNPAPYERFDDGGYREKERPFERKRESLASLVAENLPRKAGAKEISGVVAAFRRAAEGAESGKLRFRSDTLADLNRSLQVAASPSWIPLFRALLAEADRRGVKTGEETARFLNEAADEIERAGTRVKDEETAEEDEVVSVTEVEEETKGTAAPGAAPAAASGPVVKVEKAAPVCVGGNCAGGR